MTFEPITQRFIQSCYKTHSCVWCGELINKGRNAMYRSYKLNGDFNSDWMHMACFRAMGDMDDKVEEWQEGDFVRGTNTRVDEDI